MTKLYADRAPRTLPGELERNTRWIAKHTNPTYTFVPDGALFPETAVLTKEKIMCGAPQRLRWAFVVRVGHCPVDRHGTIRNGAFYGGCMIFPTGNDPKAETKALACLARYAPQEV